MIRKLLSLFLALLLLTTPLLFATPAHAFLVDPLPSDNLVVNPWFRDPTDPTEPSIFGWTDETPDPYGWHTSQKDLNPSPDEVAGTSARWADGGGMGGGGIGDGGIDAYIYQVVAGDPTNQKLNFKTWWVTHDALESNINIYGSGQADGPWTHVWTIDEINPHNSQDGVWVETELAETRLANGFPYYKIQVHANYEASAIGGMKFNGVYFSNPVVLDANGNEAPAAYFSMAPGTGNAPLDVNFDASSANDRDGNIVSYDWTLGDGETATGVTLTHTYNSPGNYPVSLTVTDDDGFTDTFTQVVEVGDPNTGTNILVNPGFEKGELNWDLSNEGGGGFLVDTETHTGNWSLEMNEPGDRTKPSVDQEVSVVGEVAYTASFWVKHLNIEGKMSVYVEWYDDSGSLISQNPHQVGDDITGSGDWTRIESQLSSPSDAVEAKFVIISLPSRAGGTGTAWFDDVELAGPNFSPPPSDTTAPLPPENLIATTVSTSQIDLNWNDNLENDLSHYNVYRGSASSFTPSDSTRIASGITASSYSDMGLSSGLTYYYLVTAVDSSGNESGSSNEASATADTDTVSPQVSSVSAIDSTHVQVVYSESVEKTSAESLANYSIDQGITISSAILLTDAKTLDLTTSEHTDGAYTLTVSNAQDLSGNVLDPNPTLTTYDIATSPVENKLLNPGFEEGGTSWTNSSAKNRSIVTSETHSGTNSLKITSHVSRDLEVYQDVSVTAGSTYDASGWVKTSEIQVGALIVITWLDSSGSPIATDTVGLVTGTQDWTFLSGNFTAPSNAAQARFNLLLDNEPDGNGTAWYDDFEFLGS